MSKSLEAALIVSSLVVASVALAFWLCPEVLCPRVCVQLQALPASETIDSAGDRLAAEKAGE